MTFCSKIFVCWSFQLQIGMGGLNDIQWTCQLQVQSMRLAAACCLALPTFSRLRTLPVISRANADTSKRGQRSPLHTTICVQAQVFRGQGMLSTPAPGFAQFAKSQYLQLERQDPIGTLHRVKTTPLWQVLCCWNVRTPSGVYME